MTAKISRKKAFMGIIVVDGCNPNGDPAYGNIPRTNFDGCGEISDVCLKRKIRNRIAALGHEIFVQDPTNITDGCDSLKERAEKAEFYKSLKKDSNQYLDAAKKKWFDVRAFGQVFAFKGKQTESKTVGARGCVSMSFATSILPISIQDVTMVKVAPWYGDGKFKDTIGSKHIVKKSAYVFTGGISDQLAQINGFTEDDANLLKECIITMFEGDESSARPAGSMILSELFWWDYEDNKKHYNPFKLFRSVEVLPKEEFPYYEINRPYVCEEITEEHITCL